MKAISYQSLMLGLALAGSLATADAQSSLFTYQGRLVDHGSPATGLYDLKFVLRDAETGGVQVPGSPIVTPCAAVTNGLFTVSLDFGAAAFSGAPRWLDIGVRAKGDLAAHTPLSPRQPLTATPYAIQAANAASAGALLGILPGTQLAGTYGGALTFNNPANHFTGDGAGLNNVNASLLGGLNAAAFWKRHGDAGTTPGLDFLGTTDNQPLEFRVNNFAILRLDPSGSITGGGGNTIAESSFAAVIGGGETSTIGPNAPYTVIGGGEGNVVQSNSSYSVIGGGLHNIVGDDAPGSVIPGGYDNHVQNNAYAAAISGGAFNTNGANGSVIGGGYWNTTQTNAGGSTIGGGGGNTVRTSARFATIPGGASNEVAGAYGFAAGRRAKANHDGAFVVADSTDADFASTATNQFAVRASGGVRLETGGTGLTVDGQSLFAGGQLAPNTVNSAAIVNGTITASEVNAPSFATVFWKADGNAGTTPGTHFLGTTDNQPLEFKVNGLRAMRLEPSFFSTPNVIGGHAQNSVGRSFHNDAGATIAGGGTESSPNYIDVSSFSTIGGGLGNSVGASDISVGACTIGGGSGNRVFSGYNCTIAGGAGNGVTGIQSTIGGGSSNRIFLAHGSTIGGGAGNTIQPDAQYSFIGGGIEQRIGAGALEAVIVGGAQCIIGTGAFRSAIVNGGRSAIEDGSFEAFIGGGSASTIRSNSPYCVIGGGWQNHVGSGSLSCTILGGSGNSIGDETWYGAIGGGLYNSVGTDATYATIPGGYSNAVAASFGFAAGCRAKAIHQGALVWGDSIDADIASTTANSWTVRASGGTRFFSDSGASVGVQLAAGGNAWSALSDRNAKENFQPVDARAVLEKVSRLPVTQWNLKTQPAGVRHLGPMAQDFAAAFGLGEDDRHISTSDADGVALAAIQGLNQKVEEAAKAKDTRIQVLEKELAELKALVTPLLRSAHNRNQ